jgi:acyl-homoserine lactone acylase PvdQ
MACPIFADARPTTGNVVIHRDEFGVPYILGGTDRDAAFGIGYAMAEDRLGDLYANVRTAIGRASEAFGEGNGNIDTDYAMRLVKNADRAKRTFAASPAPAQELMTAFVAGVKAFEAKYPEKRPEWALDLEPWHPVAIGQAMVMRWPLGQVQDELRNTRNSNGFGSNQWAISPSRSADKVAILLTDPHLTWEGMAVFYEAHVFGDNIQMQGFFLVGSPTLALGHNGHVGWAATTGGPDTADIYQLELNPANRMQYKYDGEWRTAKIEFIQIPVKGKETPVSRPAGITHLGPLFAEPDYENGIAFAGATPYIESTGLGEQFYRMCLAKNDDEFYEALSLNEYMEQNIMFADRDGTIRYVRVGRVPIRADGYDWLKAVPGNTSETAWTGIHPIADLVQIKDPAQGYMQNCNISPANMMEDSPLTPDKYPSYIYNVSWDGNNTRGKRALQMLSSDDSITKEEAIAIAMDVYDVLAKPWQVALARALEGRPGLQIVTTEPVTSAANLIAAWDGQFTKESEAASIVFYWRQKAQGNVNEEKLLSGESLSHDENVALIKGLREACEEMTRLYGTTKVPWGDIHKVGRNGNLFPVDGVVMGSGENRTRTLFNVGAREQEKGSGVYVANNGSMSMVLMFFHKDGIETYTCTPWGQSADPASPHHTDQAEKLYSQRKFKPVAITPEAAVDRSKSKVELSTT